MLVWIHRAEYEVTMKDTITIFCPVVCFFRSGAGLITGLPTVGQTLFYSIGAIQLHIDGVEVVVFTSLVRGFSWLTRSSVFYGKKKDLHE